ncbi:hypothetical protein BH20VER2_BH20VER2_17810 [soil metagenome]|nr:topoisomerase DNA-binding C4 zinc finger domain-containing protein [Chthoniobacterales bacterium]
MPNPQLEQFSHELLTKAGVTILLCAIAALLLRELLRRVERKATQPGRSERAAPEAEPTSVSIPAYSAAASALPNCPACDARMVKRRARSGVNAGAEFWGCSGYPGCRGTLPV